jgi:hypothetical protein
LEESLLVLSSKIEYGGWVGLKEEDGKTMAISNYVTKCKNPLSSPLQVSVHHLSLVNVEQLAHYALPSKNDGK